MSAMQGAIHLLEQPAAQDGRQVFLRRGLDQVGLSSGDFPHAGHQGNNLLGAAAEHARVLCGCQDQNRTRNPGCGLAQGHQESQGLVRKRAVAHCHSIGLLEVLGNLIDHDQIGFVAQQFRQRGGARCGAAHIVRTHQGIPRRSIQLVGQQPPHGACAFGHAMVGAYKGGQAHIRHVVQSLSDR